MDDCHAVKHVPPVYGQPGQLSCALPMAHQGGLHYDRALGVWWMPALPGSVREDVPSAVRMNEDIPAMLQEEWMRL